MIKLGLCAALFLGSVFTTAETARDVNQYIEFEIETGVPRQTVELRTDLYGWESRGYKLKETRPGVYSISIPKPWTQYAQIEYKFLINGRDWVVDPKNPNLTPDENGGYNSVRETRFQESRLLKPLPESKIWNTETLTMDSPSGTRKVFVLTPPFKTSQPLTTIYLNDGVDYLRQGELALVLANYYELGGEPFAAVLISNTASRFDEYGTVGRNTYDKWVEESVIPQVESRYSVSRNAKDRVIMGASMGGLASLRAGLLSNKFGNVVTQSGSFFFPDSQGNKFTDILDNRVQAPRVWSSYGSFEGYGIKDTNRALPAQLTARNIPNQMTETPSVHDWVAWRNQFEDILNWIEHRN